MQAFNTFKTIAFSATTTAASVALPIPTGSVDLKGCFYRAWTSTGQAVIKFGDNTVVSNASPTSNVLDDGNIPVTTNFETVGQIPAGATHVSVDAVSGTPVVYIEIGWPIG